MMSAACGPVICPPAPSKGIKFVTDCQVLCEPCAPSASIPAGAASVALALLAAPPPALAETVSPVSSAFAAYAHYASLLVIAGSLAVERVTITAKPTKEELDRLVLADSLYGIAGVFLLGSGIARAKYFGKGWEFYAHSPIFWVKMGLFAVAGASSLLVTTKVVQAAIAENKSGEVPEFGEALAERMTKISASSAEAAESRASL